MRDDPIDSVLQEAVGNRDCPYCGAARGHGCVTSSGNGAAVHQGRYLPVFEAMKARRSRKDEVVTFRIDGVLAARLDRYRNSIPLPVAQSSIVRAALSEYLDRHE